jgi:hypothetical protein
MALGVELLRWPTSKSTAAAATRAAVAHVSCALLLLLLTVCHQFCVQAVAHGSVQGCS